MKPENIALACGLTEKSAKAYAALISLNEATMAEIAVASGIKRTTLYSLLPELENSGAIFEILRGKRTYWKAIAPEELAKLAEEKIQDAMAMQGHDSVQKKRNPLPRISFLSGPAGFKKVWNMLFESKEREYLIITDGRSFLDFVKEKYILDDIIDKKKKLGIKSRQIITDTIYARKITKKDISENRVSRLLPEKHGIFSSTEIISTKFVAFLARRYEGSLFIVEDQKFAEARKILFETLWDSLPSPE
ncbi:MAG: helix-turn-helix domain-containing protein [Candidatus Pacebacteria bacterium]|nr:helix-turn-helix domain-containing protein [Candidatus Paceibacterota bacterium]MDD5356643.1 helix-turn-helix domain-containing protein [Candidatus Paceibacterota bacterium]